MEEETQGNPCPPFSGCWCEIHPQACETGNPPTTGLHSTVGIVILFAAIIICVFKKFK